jgi:hypothetical protein
MTGQSVVGGVICARLRWVAGKLLYYPEYRPYQYCFATATTSAPHLIPVTQAEQVVVERDVSVQVRSFGPLSSNSTVALHRRPQPSHSAARASLT